MVKYHDLVIKLWFVDKYGWLSCVIDESCDKENFRSEFKDSALIVYTTAYNKYLDLQYDVCSRSASLDNVGEIISDCAKDLRSAKLRVLNNKSLKCAREVLKIINYSQDSIHGRMIIDCIKRHFE